MAPPTKKDCCAAFGTAGAIAMSGATNHWRTMPVTPPSLGSDIPPGTITDIEVAKQRLARWVLLAFELTVFQSRNLRDDPQAREYLEGPSGLLEQGERVEQHSTVVLHAWNAAHQVHMKPVHSDRHVVRFVNTKTGAQGFTAMDTIRLAYVRAIGSKGRAGISIII